MERTSSTGNVGGPVKRPLYVLIALLLSLAFGVGGCSQGMEIIVTYWSPAPDVTDIASKAATDAERDSLKAAATKCLDATERGKGRLFPIGVASFVLGMTMAVTALRAISGRNGARAFLVQILLVQATFIVVADMATKPMRTDCFDLERGIMRVAFVERKNDPSVVDRLTPDLRNKVAFGVTAVRCAAAGLIVLALTRRRAKEYFEAMERLRSDPSEGS